MGQRLVLDLRKIDGEHSNYSVTTTRLGREIERIFGAFRTSTHRQSSARHDGGDHYYHDDEDEDEFSGDIPPSPIVFEMHTRKISVGVNGDGENVPAVDNGDRDPEQLETVHHTIEVGRSQRGQGIGRERGHTGGGENGGILVREERSVPSANVDADCGDEDRWVETVEGLQTWARAPESETLPAAFVVMVDRVSSCVYELDV